MELRSSHFETPQADFLRIAEEILGPQFDETGEQRWWCEPSDTEDVGFRVCDGTHTYFFDTDQKYGISGAKRIWYRENGEIDQISRYPIRSLSDDHPNNRIVFWF